MKRLISMIVFAAVSVTLSLSGVISYFTYVNPATTAANVVKYLTFADETHEERDVKVEIYARVYHDTEHEPVFAVCELVNKAIDYRKKHPEATDMTIDSAFYRVEYDTACYYKKGSRNYGKMTILKNKDYTDDCERVLYSFVKAAKYGIHTRLMWHIEKGLDKRPITEYFDQYLDEPCITDPTKTVGDFLEYKHCKWPNSGISQMHNKQVIVSNYLDYDGEEYDGAVYTATSNVDTHRTSNLPVFYKDWAHTGFVVSGHPYVYESNKKYFDICYRHADNRFEFANEVFEEHNKGGYLDGGLNYEDENFECYFTPLSQEHAANTYSVEDNPLAKYVEKLNDCTGRIECFLNLYFIADDPLIHRVAERINEAFKNNTNEGNKFGIVENTSLTTESPLYPLFAEIGDVTLHKMTHAKDSIFYYGDTNEYVVITGSTNWGLSNFYGQSNTIMVFKEKGEHHEIYDCFQNNYVRTTQGKK